MKKKKGGGHDPTTTTTTTRSTSSCAACKLLKRRCSPSCIFAPYFRADEPKKFAQVHKVFGASNVSKILSEVPEEHREDAVNSLSYEAEARLRDPVYGCLGPIALLHRRMVELQHDLELARAHLARYAAFHPPPPPPLPSTLGADHDDHCCFDSGDGLSDDHHMIHQLPIMSQLEGSQLSPNGDATDFGHVPLLPLWSNVVLSSFGLVKWYLSPLF